MRRVTSARERGTALLLMPAAVLVMIVLGSIAIDFGLLHVQQRQLANAADGAANDAAAFAVDDVELRRTGCVSLLHERAVAATRAGLDARGYREATIDNVAFTIVDELPSIEVTVSFGTDLILAKALPHGGGGRTLTATAAADLFDADEAFSAC